MIAANGRSYVNSPGLHSIILAASRRRGHLDNLIQVVLLGVIEGVTEFLPVSSTGHLLIAEHWLGARSDLFNIAIQSGAILAVVLIYRERLQALITAPRGSAGHAYLHKLVAAFVITAVIGFAAKKAGLHLPVTIAPVAWACIIGGVAILLIEWHVARLPQKDTVTWTVAIAVGLGQVLAAVFPGTSRSAATIFSGMLTGLTSRPAATEFAFLVGIPTMFAATGYELAKVLKSGGAAQEHWGDLAVGFAVSTVVAFVVVKWLLRYIQMHRFTVFAWYRIALGAALLVFA
jgi:undecaprenyl-diphosphatase